MTASLAHLLSAKGISMKCNPRGVALTALLVVVLWGAPFAHADDYTFVGATQDISLSGSDLTLAAEYGEYDGYSYNLVGSFTDPTTWDDAQQGYYPFANEFVTSAPGLATRSMCRGSRQVISHCWRGQPRLQKTATLSADITAMGTRAATGFS